MALYAFDGTGNQDDDDNARDSNVVRFFDAYVDPQKNDDPDKDTGSLYVKGIGRLAHTLVGMGVAEAFGIGGHRRVEQAMARLKRNRRRGDSTVDVVGLSRGAALALSFVNEIADALPQQKVRFLGLFDVVGQFGLPGPNLNAGHRLTLPGNVGTCRHAMAIHESRAFFPLTRLCDKQGTPAKSLVELWFTGVHSDVGGGNGNRGLNSRALQWMFMNARRAGLPIAQDAIDRNLADQALSQKISVHKVDLEVRRSCFGSDCLHASVALVAGREGPFRPMPTLPLRHMDDEGAFT